MPPTQSYIFSLDSNGWLTAECPSAVVSSTFSQSVLVFIFRLDIMDLRGDGEDGVMKQHLFTFWGQEKHVIQMRMISVLVYHIAPLDGNVSTGKFSAEAQALWNLSPSLPPSFLFLTLFSRRWSSINTQQWGIYREDFVLSSEANNYQIWWKIEHILRLNVISLSLRLSRTCARTHTDTFGWVFFTHRDTHTQVLPSEARFIYVL